MSSCHPSQQNALNCPSCLTRGHTRLEKNKEKNLSRKSRKHETKVYTNTGLNDMLPWSIYWVACGTCYRKSEGTELCRIELQHSSLRRITNKREARNIGFWADMLIIFKFPHNFFTPQVCPLSIWLLCNTKIHWSSALSGGVSVRMGDQNNKPLVKHNHLTENTINANKCELSKVQILLACFMQNKYWCKSK